MGPDLKSPSSVEEVIALIPQIKEYNAGRPRDEHFYPMLPMELLLDICERIAALEAAVQR